MSFRQFDSQFAETSWERQDRWRATRAKRKAEGKCWQCAKLIAECRCPNVSHQGQSRLPPFKENPDDQG